MNTKQDHTGIGNNVIAELYEETNIYHSISIDSLTMNVHELMYHVAAGSHEIALQTIETYRKLSLSNETRNLFSILVSYIKATQGEMSLDIDLLKRELNSNSSSPFIDLYKTILVRSIVKGDSEKAKEAYIDFMQNAKIYLLAFYNELVASKEELLDKLEMKLVTLDDYSLFYLAQGLWRVQEYKLSNKAFQHISPIGQSENIKYWLVATELNSMIYDENHLFSYMHRDTHRKIKSIEKEFLSLISNKSGLNALAVSILITLVKITQSTANMPEIREVALKFRKDIYKFDKDLGDTLEKIAENKSFIVPEWLIPKLENNQPFDEDQINVLIKAVLNKSIEIDLVERWLNQSAVMLATDASYVDFIRVLFLSFKDSESVVEQNQYLFTLNNFLRIYSSQLKDISPAIIKYWCDNLSRLNTSFEVPIYKILKTVCKDLAVDSDLSLYYFQSLLHLDKLETLGMELDRIEDHEWDYELYLIQARYYLRINEYVLAQETYLKLIDEAKDLHVWYEYLLSFITDEKDTALAKKQLSRIPTSLLSTKTNGFSLLLFQIAQVIDFDFAERIVVRLFVENPTENAPLITQFYLNSFTNKSYDETDENKQFEGVHGGFVYRINGDIHKGLLVDDSLALHTELIGIHSHFGKLLTESPEGTESEHNISTFTLIGRQSVSVTVFQSAMDIVSRSQHTYSQPMFYELEVREESVIEDTVKALQLIKSKVITEEKPEEFLRSSDLSLYLKGKIVGKSRTVGEEIDVVHGLLLNEYANQCLTKAGGNIAKVDTVVVDIYGAVYLCMTNLYKSIIASEVIVYMSRETVKAIQLWIASVTNDSYLKIAEHDGQLFRTDSTTVRTTSGNLLDGLNDLLEYAITKSEKLFDLPTVISEVKGFVSESVFSSIKLALSHDIPLLCLDYSIRSILALNNEFKVVDFQNFVHNYISHEYLTYEDRRQAIVYLAFNKLYAEYYLTDALELTKDIDSLPILIKLLNDVPLEIPNSDISIVFFVQLIKNIIQLGFEKRFIKKGFRGKEHLKLAVKNIMYDLQGSVVQGITVNNTLYAIFSQAIRCIEGTTVEARLTQLIIRIETLTLSTQHLNYFYSILESFIFGHFLDINNINQLLNFSVKDVEPQ